MSSRLWRWRCDNLASDEIIDFEDSSIQDLVKSLLKKSSAVEDYIRNAYAVDPEADEADIMVVYPDPDKLVLSKLARYQSRQELWDDLPDHLQCSQATFSSC